MRYLIVKTSAFGDIIHAYPVVELLKECDPNAQVDWVVEKRMSALVKGHPLVDRCIEVDTKSWRKKFLWKEFRAFLKSLRQERYDAVFDLQGNIKSGLITFFSRACHKVGFGFKSAPEAVSALFYSERFNPPKGQNVRDDYLLLAQQFLGTDKRAATTTLLQLTEQIEDYSGAWLIAPGSNWVNKQLTYEQLVAFLTHCQSEFSPKFIFLCGSEAEKTQALKLVATFPGSRLLYKPTLAVLQHSMAKLDLAITMDSLPLHLAASAQCPTFSFFGPSSSSKYNPPGVSHGVFQGSCPYGITFEKRCPRLRTCPTGACLREVSPDSLFAAFKTWLFKVKLG